MAAAPAEPPVPGLQIRPGHPDFLDLPWHERVDSWDTALTVDMPTGVHRHPIVFVAYPEGIYAVKELSAEAAAREFDNLRTLEERTARSVRPAGLVRRPWLDRDEEGAGALITRYAEYTFPYRELVSGAGFGVRRDQMLDAFAGLLVELHLAGCFWGDCSLSNVLYRFDAGAIETIMVDAETTSIYDSISTGRRREDLAIMQENLAGGMADIAAQAGEDLDHADLEIGADIAGRYQALWQELTEALLITPGERYLIRQRIDRLNDLGFAVDEMEVTPDASASRVRITVKVGGRSYHSDRLRRLAGIEASEEQARYILADIARHEARHGVTDVDRAVTIMSWRTGRFEPFTRRIAELQPGANPVQGYADFLNYRYLRSVEAGKDLESMAAFEAWVAADMPGFEPVP